MSKLIVSEIGPASSVQDGGRHGAQRYGLTPSGAMDQLALAAANVLVGNTPFAAAIEIGPFGAAFTAREGAVRVAVAGASRNTDISGRAVAWDASMTLADGQTLTLGFARGGSFSYLAIEGGIMGEPMFGSLAVNARAGLGSPYPRPLQAGDQLQTPPASGAPDRGTSGGYPKIATVITADLGRFAQIPAGKSFRFKAVSMAEAQVEARNFAQLLGTLPDRLRSIDQFDLNIEALSDANVAGAAVSAVDARTWQIPSPADALAPD